MRPPIATLVLAGALVLGAACGGGSKGASNVAPELKGAQVNDTELVSGRALWITECQRCHAPAGQGLTGPRLAGVVKTTFPDIQNEINVVANGTGAMPAWGGKLTPAQIRAVVTYTRDVL